jgi:hypothetical protein
MGEIPQGLVLAVINDDPVYSIDVVGGNRRVGGIVCILWLPQLEQDLRPFLALETPVLL